MALTAKEQQELAALEAKYAPPKEAPKSALSPMEEQELADLESKYGAEQPQQEPQSFGSRAFDYGMRALDYAGGASRYAAAGLANVPYAMATGKSFVKPEDLGKVLSGQAPSTAEYMERAGVPEGARINLSPMEGDTSVRDIGGFVGDIALDPLTYMTMGGSAAKSGVAGKALSSTATKALRPLSDTAESAGKAMYKSGFKKIDERLVEKGKKLLGETLLEKGAPTGTTKTISKKMAKIGEDALSQRNNLYKQATDLGVTIDLGYPLKETEKLVSNLTSKKSMPRIRQKAADLMDMLNEIKREGKVDVETLSAWKSKIYDALPENAFGLDGKPKGIYAEFDKALASDFRKAIIDAGEAAKPGLGKAIDANNKVLETMLTAKKPTKMQIRRGETPNMFTSVDGILSALNPKTLPAKKLSDAAKTTYVRTKGGKGLINAGKSGLLDSTARRGLIDRNR